MVAQGENVNELHAVRELVVLLREDVKGVNARFGELSKQVGELSTYVIQTQAREQAHNLPTKIDGLGSRIEAQNLRIQALENARATDQAMYAGQLKVARWVAAVASFVSLILGIWLAVKALSGK
jgi:hypothetical protein